MAWPQGIQNGLGERVAILLNETADVQAMVSKYGYRYYTSIEEFKEYISFNICLIAIKMAFIALHGQWH